MYSVDVGAGCGHQPVIQGRIALRSLWRASRGPPTLRSLLPASRGPPTLSLPDPRPPSTTTTHPPGRARRRAHLVPPWLFVRRPRRRQLGRLCRACSTTGPGWLLGLRREPCAAQCKPVSMYAMSHVLPSMSRSMYLAHVCGAPRRRRDAAAAQRGARARRQRHWRHL